ncbi:hypothetical protein CYJ69_02725 [Gardnerella pickettii]|nr:hypothetical protein CYJ69_02725 [Gardnerella pickettii]
MKIAVSKEIYTKLTENVQNPGARAIQHNAPKTDIHLIALLSFMPIINMLLVLPTPIPANKILI